MVLNQYLSQLLILFKRLLLVYILYFLCRLIFYVFNYGFFQTISVGELIALNFYALRFDTFSVFVSNSLFILLSILPFNFINKQSYQKLLLWVYASFNTVFMVFNLVDVVYYPYIKKRSTADILKQAGGQTDLTALLPRYINDYWYLIIIMVVLVFLLVKLYKKIHIKPAQYVYSLKNTSLLIGSFLLSSSFVVIGIRGGLQRVPIDVVDAGKYAQPQNISLLMNSPFTIIKSLEKDELSKLDFNFQGIPIQTIYNPINRFEADTFKKLNVVVIILESFSKEYTKLSGLRSYTPFLDSLTDNSLIFSNAYSNGHKSIEGIPAILSSMPSLMENPLINSAYAGNNYESLASLLRKEGYTTAFFHGGINGTMNFDSYAAQAGYSNYYGKNEYGNDKDFDGFWGIWDEPFLGFSVTKISDMKEPFHSSIFTLSSHHPYLIPKQHTGKFQKGTLENHESIGYGDYALRQFFTEAKKQKWFNRTLFVITADHCSVSYHSFYRNNLGQFSIPILFYMSDNSLKGNHTGVFQQTDIMPSVLNQLGYTKPFFSFGRSYKDTKEHYVNYYTNSSHYMLTDSLLFNFNGNELSSVFKYKSDSLLINNMATKYPFNKEKTYYKAFIQTYNNSLINNTCLAK